MVLRCVTCGKARQGRFAEEWTDHEEGIKVRCFTCVRLFSRIERIAAREEPRP